MPLPLPQAVLAANKSASKPIIHIEGEEIPYFGSESSPGIMEAWRIQPFPFQQLLNPRFTSRSNAQAWGMTFCHVTPTKNVTDGFNGSALRATGDDKEYGPGFYSMCGQTASPGGDCYVLGAEWFGKKQNELKWSVLAFEIPSMLSQWFLETAGGSIRLQFLHYLTTPQGYPSGALAPTPDDLRGIQQLNARGRVLIFPDDPQLEVDVGGGRRMCAADVQHTQGRNLPGAPWLVIGPQKPDYLSARQIAWTHGVGLWMINSAPRTIAFNNKL